MADVVQQGRDHQAVVGTLGVGQRCRLQGVLQHGHALAVGLAAVAREQRLDLLDDGAHAPSRTRSLLSSPSLSA